MDEQGRTNLTEAVRSTQLLKIDGYCAAAAMDYSEFIKSSWNVDGHDWEVHFHPKYFRGVDDDWVTLKLILVSEPQGNKLMASLSGRLVDPSGNRDPSVERSASRVFESREKCSSEVFLMKTEDVGSSGYLVNDSLIVHCTITVLKELSGVVVPAVTEAVALPLPSSDLQRDLGELLHGQTGADVTFVLESGERFPAHKAILAARSPVFMAEFFGHMSERSSECVRIEDLEAAAFKAMLHFIYTNSAPEVDEESRAAATMAQHLPVAADRYGLDRLKLICEGKVADGIVIDTAAMTLVLAEQYNCSLLKAKCVDFIARSRETLDAVLATDGYKHIVESCPSVLTELLKAAHGRGS